MLFYKSAFLLLLGAATAKVQNADDGERKQLEKFIAAGAHLILKYHLLEILIKHSQPYCVDPVILLNAVAANKLFSLNFPDSVKNSSEPQESLKIALANNNVRHPPSSSCAAALSPNKPSGEYTLKVPGFEHLKPFRVYCLQDPNGGTAWTMLMQRRNGRTNFDRNWTDYKFGFGNISDEFFIGMEPLHALTTYQKQELWIEMEDYNNRKAFAKYDHFAIGDEASKYVINALGVFSGDAGDSLKRNFDKNFTTYDHNDGIPVYDHCQGTGGGAWWYAYGLGQCSDSNLFGLYYWDGSGNRAISWLTWTKEKLKNVFMAIRPVK